MKEIHRDIPEIKIFMESIGCLANAVSVVLIGSVARQTNGEKSDIDLLVISKEPWSAPKLPDRVHLMKTTYAEFIQQLKAGEDFEAWCVRFGVVLHDNGLWLNILESAGAQQWPQWKKTLSMG